MRAGLLVSFVVIASGCSFSAATGFTECTLDAHCGATRACLSGYCIAMPDGCQRAEGNFERADRIPLVALLPLTDADNGGAVDDSEVNGLRAMSLAIQEANDRDGINGQPFALYQCDTRRDKDRIVTQLDWMVAELQTPAVITSGSSQTIAAANATSRQNAGTMIMSATSTSPELVALFQRDNSVWRVAPPDTSQADVMAQLFASDPQYVTATRIAVAYEDTAYGQGLANALRAKLVAQGRNVQLIQFTPPVDASILANQLDAFHDGVTPRATVLVAFPTDIRNIIVNAKARSDLAVSNGHRWMLSDSAKDRIILDASTSSELVGMLGTAPAQGAGAAFSVFQSRFQARYGVDPADYSFTSHSYDAMWLTMLSAAAAKKDGAVTGAAMNKGMTRLSATGQMARQLLATEWQASANALVGGSDIDVEGSSGPLNFDLTVGAPASPYEIFQITSSGFTTLRVVQP